MSSAVRATDLPSQEAISSSSVTVSSGCGSERRSAYGAIESDTLMVTVHCDADSGRIQSSIAIDRGRVPRFPARKDVSRRTASQSPVPCDTIATAGGRRAHRGSLQDIAMALRGARHVGADEVHGLDLQTLRNRTEPNVSAPRRTPACGPPRRPEGSHLELLRLPVEFGPEPAADAPFPSCDIAAGVWNSFAELARSDKNSSESPPRVPGGLRMDVVFDSRNRRKKHARSRRELTDSIAYGGSFPDALAVAACAPPERRLRRGRFDLCVAEGVPVRCREQDPFVRLGHPLGRREGDFQPTRSC